MRNDHLDLLETFRQESSDLMRKAEQAILALEMAPDDIEACHELFRSVHTVKGSAGIVGLNDAASFGHQFETLLSEFRDGRITATPEFIDLVLQAMDHFRSRIDAGLRGERSVSPDEQRLRNAMLAMARHHPPRPAVPEPVPNANGPVRADRRAGATTNVFRIRFRPGRDFFRQGNDPAPLIRALSDLGALETSAQTEGIPELPDLDPEACYLAWDFVLTTNVAREAVEEVFAFLPEYVQIEAQNDSGSTDDSGSTENAERRAFEPPTSGGPMSSTAKRDTRVKDTEQFIRVRIDKIDQVVDLVGEVALAYASSRGKEWSDHDSEVNAHRLDVLLRQLQDTTLALRLVPVEGLFSRMRRLVRDLSRQTGKRLNLVISGEETEIDRSVAERLHDILLHLVRNSIDHGIESAEARIAIGKSAAGRLELRATQTGGEIQIEVSDDGRGLDRASILAQARARGLIAPGIEPNDQQVWSFIFEPGLSTKHEVTGLSGRGVGMDVVKREIEAIRGHISIRSISGQGTTMTLHIPLTLVILDAMLARVSDVLFAVPLERITEIVQPGPDQMVVLDTTGQRVLRLREHFVPVLQLAEYYGLVGCDRRHSCMLLAVESGGRSLAFPIDEILGQQQVVVKPLAGYLKGVRAASGCALLGSGEVAIVIDTLQLIDSHEQRTA